MHQISTTSNPIEILFQDGMRMINSKNIEMRLLGATALKGLYECGEQLTELNKKHGLDNTGVKRTMAMLKQIINDA